MMEPKSLNQIITEDEFVRIAQEPCTNFFEIYNLFSARMERGKNLSRKLYSNLIQEAEFLESFLDEYGARENKRWNAFSEYVASIRNLMLAAFFIRHILDRYPYYNLRESDEIGEAFSSHAHNALDFLNQSILKLYKELVRSGKENGLEVTADSLGPHEFAEIEVNKRLPRNIAEDEVKEEEERIIEICEKVQHVAKMMNDTKIEPTQDLEELKNLVLGKIDEKRARLYKNMIHNVQSDFDTYVKNTRIEQENPIFKVFRGYISIPLHLLDVVLWLSHFFERHEDEIRHGACRQKISQMVSKGELLDKIINFGFWYSLYFIREGDKLASEILANFVKVIRAELPIPKPLGFHARPSTYISLIARQYGGETCLIVDGQKYDAKSVMSMLQAAGTIADKGYETVLFEGDKRVIDDLKILAKHNYCEDEEIPPKLSYLRDVRNTA